MKNKIKLFENELSDTIGEEIDEISNSIKIPGHTCPLIDEVKGNIHDILNDVKAVRRGKLTYEEFADAVEMNLYHTEATLEEIRTANDKLREIGYEWYAFAKRAFLLAKEYQPTSNNSK